MNIIKKIQKDRYKRLGKYLFDRWIFQAAMLLIFAWIFFIAWSYDFSLNYFYCPENADGSIQGNKVMLRDYSLDGAVKEGNCRNPFYKNDWTSEEYLPPGEYGTKPGPLFTSAQYVAYGGLLLALLLNHFWYNRKYKLVEAEK